MRSLNGYGDYGYLLTAIDGDMTGGDGIDRFRIKIWAKDSNWGMAGVIYDNQMGKSDTGNDATELGGGIIVSHQ